MSLEMDSDGGDGVENGPDLESFPLLHPESIGRLSSEWLQRSQVQIEPLLAALSGSSDPDDIDLCAFAARQRAAVAAELEKRLLGAVEEDGDSVRGVEEVKEKPSWLEDGKEGLGLVYGESEDGKRGVDEKEGIPSWLSSDDGSDDISCDKSDDTSSSEPPSSSLLPPHWRTSPAPSSQPASPTPRFDSVAMSTKPGVGEGRRRRGVGLERRKSEERGDEDGTYPPPQPSFAPPATPPTSSLPLSSSPALKRSATMSGVEASVSTPSPLKRSKTSSSPWKGGDETGGGGGGGGGRNWSDVPSVVAEVMKSTKREVGFGEAFVVKTTRRKKRNWGGGKKKKKLTAEEERRLKVEKRKEEEREKRKKKMEERVKLRKQREEEKVMRKKKKKVVCVKAEKVVEKAKVADKGDHEGERSGKEALKVEEVVEEREVGVDSKATTEREEMFEGEEVEEDGGKGTVKVAEKKLKEEEEAVEEVDEETEEGAGVVVDEGNGGEERLEVGVNVGEEEEGLKVEKEEEGGNDDLRKEESVAEHEEVESGEIVQVGEGEGMRGADEICIERDGGGDVLEKDGEEEVGGETEKAEEEDGDMDDEKREVEEKDDGGGSLVTEKAFGGSTVVPKTRSDDDVNVDSSIGEESDDAMPTATSSDTFHPLSHPRVVARMVEREAPTTSDQDEEEDEEEEEGEDEEEEVDEGRVEDEEIVEGGDSKGDGDVGGVEKDVDVVVENDREDEEGLEGEHVSAVDRFAAVLAARVPKESEQPQPPDKPHPSHHISKDRDMEGEREDGDGKGREEGVVKEEEIKDDVERVEVVEGGEEEEEEEEEREAEEADTSSSPPPPSFATNFPEFRHIFTAFHPSFLAFREREVAGGGLSAGMRRREEEEAKRSGVGGRRSAKQRGRRGGRGVVEEAVELARGVLHYTNQALALRAFYGGKKESVGDEVGGVEVNAAAWWERSAPKTLVRRVDAEAGIAGGDEGDGGDVEERRIGGSREGGMFGCDDEEDGLSRLVDGKSFEERAMEFAARCRVSVTLLLGRGVAKTKHERRSLLDFVAAEARRETIAKLRQENAKIPLPLPRDERWFEIVGNRSEVADLVRRALVIAWNPMALTPVHCPDSPTASESSQPIWSAWREVPNLDEDSGSVRRDPSISSTPSTPSSPSPSPTPTPSSSSSSSSSVPWHLQWAWGKPRVVRGKLLVWQRVNHFKHARELTRKDLLKKNLARYQCLGGRLATAFTILPPTFVLPKEYLQFAECFGKAMFGTSSTSSSGSGGGGGDGVGGAAMMALAAATASRERQRWDGLGIGARERSGSEEKGEKEEGLGKKKSESASTNVWILKPVGMSRGRGITMVRDIGDVRTSREAVIQKYISNPLLLDGFKFDLRIYVLVTSFSPLEAFIYTKGFARMSSRPFSMDGDDKFVHLTNSSIQKQFREEDGDEKRRSTVDKASGEAEGGGTKVSLSYLWRRLEKDQGIDRSVLWDAICDVVVRSLVCVDDVIPHQPNSFEVFGYDVLLDTSLRAWLIEVNSSPSMAVDSLLDARIKLDLIRDTVALVNPPPFSHRSLSSVISHRLRKTADFKKRPHVVPASAGIGTGAGRTANPEQREALDQDLHEILQETIPRPYGTLPPTMGAYQRLCPGSPAYNRILKLKFQHFSAAAGKSKLKALLSHK